MRRGLPTGATPVFELIDQCDRIDWTRPCRVENRLVIGAFRIHDNRDIVIAQSKHFGREPDAFGVARTDAAVDLDSIGHMTEWEPRALK